MRWTGRKGFLLAALWGFTLLQAASAATLYVNGASGQDSWDGLAAVNAGGHGPKATIQAALAAAAAGDTVLVAPGIYQGQGNRDLDFAGKALTLKSANGPDTTTINCQGDPVNNHCGFSFTSNETAATVLQGFTICNGYNNRGGGIFIRQASPTIRGCIIRDNTAVQYGGGIYCEGGAGTCRPVIQANRIMANFTMGSGGGIGLFAAGAQAIIVNNVIVGNHSGTKGGGLNLFTPNTAPVLANNSVANNSAPNGGGICFEGSGPLKLSNCIVWQNTATIGPQLSLLSFGDLYPSEVTLDYTNVQAPVSIYVDPGSILHTTTTLAFNPLFINPGYWQGDIWVAGDYRLRANSPLVNAGNNQAASQVTTDLKGDTRISGTKVDLGAYEVVQNNNMAVTRLTVTPGALAGKDMFVLMGALQDRGFQPAVNGLTFKLGSFSQTIAPASLRQLGAQQIYQFTSANSGISSLNLNLATGFFTVVARSADLRGVKAPIGISLESGTYTAQGIADETVINGPAVLSLRLLRGVEDSLSVTQPQVVPAAQGLASLIVRGGIVRQTPTDLRLAGTTVQLQWGEFSESLPGSGFAKIGNQYIWRRPAGDTHKTTLALFDFEQCAFVLVVNNAPLQRSGTVRLGLAFQNFNQTVDVNLP